VIGYGLGLAVTSRFLWTAPYTNEILDVDTSKVRSIASMQTFSYTYIYTSVSNIFYFLTANILHGFTFFCCNPAEDTSLLGCDGLASSKILPIDSGQISKNHPKILCFQNCLNYN